MTDMIMQDPIDEMDDLRSLGESDNESDLQDDLRSLAVDTPKESVSEVEDSEKETEDELVVASSDASDEEDIEEDDDEELEVVAETLSTDDSEEDEDTEEAVEETPSAPIAVSRPVAPLAKPEPVAALETPQAEKAPVEQTALTAAPQAKVEAQTRNDDEYNPSFALKVFMIVRQGFVNFFDFVLTILAIIVERIAAIDWAGIFGTIADFFGMLNDMMQERVPQKFHMLVYALIAILFVSPLAFGAFALFSKGNTGDTLANGQTVNVSQPNTVVIDNGILSPLFTPTVQQWAENIASWTANSSITPDMFATLMQIESCGNPTVQGGLFGLGDANANFNDADAQAMLAINKLQAALNSSNGDFAMAMAVYADGESVLASDFSTWSYHARDMYILGRNIFNQAQQGYTSSPDLNSWLQNTGSVLCTEAQTTFNN